MTDTLRLDVRSAFRSLGRARGTAAAAVLTLAVAVGLNLAMFGLIDRALLSPPAHVPDAGRVFTLAFEHELENGTRARMTTTSYVTFETVRERVPALADAAAWQRITTSAVVDGAQIGAEAMLVSGSYFELLGVRPLLGRGLLPEDDAPPAGLPIAVLSYAFWMGAFGGDRAVLGRRVTVRGMELTVAGVMPAGFSGHSAARVDVWVPFHAAMRETPGWDHDQFRNIAAVVVRVARTETPASAAAQAGAVMEKRAGRVTLSPIGGGDVTATEQRIAYWLTGVSVLVLIIGLANSATLLLVRGAGRRRDLAIRSRPRRHTRPAAVAGARRSRDSRHDDSCRGHPPRVLVRRSGAERASAVGRPRRRPEPADPRRRRARRRPRLPGRRCRGHRADARSFDSRVVDRSLRAGPFDSRVVDRSLRAGSFDAARFDRSLRAGAPSRSDDDVGRAAGRCGHVRAQPVQPGVAGFRHAH